MTCKAGKLGPGPGKYLLPSTVGYPAHDATKFRSPQYSMALKLPHSYKSLGPGPQYDIKGFTRYGKHTPAAYTLSDKYKALVPQKRPGPAEYTIRRSKVMPEYSMSFRHKSMAKSCTPGPDIYNLRTTIGGLAIDKRSSPIYSLAGNYKPLACGLKSPGPAGYEIGPVELFKTKMPIFSMRLKTDTGPKSITPGPQYLPIRDKRGDYDYRGGYSFGLKTDTCPYITPEDDMPCI